MNIYEFCADEKDPIKRDKKMAEAIKLVMYGGGNHTDAPTLYMSQSGWVGKSADKESYAIVDLRNKMESAGLTEKQADILISAVWRDETKRPPGFGRVRLRVDEVCMYLFDRFLSKGWDAKLSPSAAKNLEVLRDIVSHIPPPRRIVVHSYDETGWFILEGTKRE